MKLPHNVPLFRSFKFAPIALFSLFLFTNVTGILFSRALAPVAIANPNDADLIPTDIPSSGDKDLDMIIFRAGKREGVDPRFIHAVIWQESKYVSNARSRAGAQGLMQLIPDTAKRFGCSHPDDPADNIKAGTKYLGWLLKRFGGNVQLALAGYNAGEGAVDKYNGVPPYNETQNYVRIISERYGKTYHPVLQPKDAIQAFHLQDSAETSSTQ
jgi:soluble lytic murein transglycosylase-like protein